MIVHKHGSFGIGSCKMSRGYCCATLFQNTKVHGTKPSLSLYVCIDYGIVLCFKT